MTCIINNAGRRKSTFFDRNSTKATFYTRVVKVYINFQCKNKTFKTITKLTDTIPLIRVKQ